MKKIALLTVAFMLLQIAALSADECRLMAVIGNGYRTLIYSDDAIDAMRILQNQGNTSNPHGWGLAYYLNGEMTTGEGTIWTGQNSVSGNRYADNAMAYGNGHYTQMESEIRNLYKHIIIGHVRYATTPPFTIPDPHPFIYETDINSFSFVQNGGPHIDEDEDYTETLRARLLDLSNTYGWHDSLYGWHDEQLEELYNTSIDSGVYFGYLMAFIKLHDYNILQGLRAAMNDAAFQNDWNKNFIMSDGIDVYAYRCYRTGEANTHTLEYCKNEYYFEEERVTLSSYAIMSVIPDDEFSNEIPGSRVSLVNDELVYFSPYFDPIHFKNMSLPTFQLCKDLKGNTTSSTNYWCWESFPVLNTALSAVDVMAQSDFDTADEVRTQSALVRLYKDEFGWHAANLPNFTQTTGYKVHLTEYDEDKAWVSGDLASENSWVTLYPNQDNWVGYWLCNSQSLHDALGVFFDDVKKVEAQKWCYLNQSTPIGFSGSVTYATSAQPMEFGKMYNIILKNDVTQPITFFWDNSRAVCPLSLNLANTEYFTFTDAADYEVVDVESVEGGEDIKEIGVFAGDTCVGASVVEEYPVQILLYTEGYEGEELSFEYWTGGRAAVESRPAVAIWNGEGFYSDRLIAGDIDYRTVTLGGTPAAKPGTSQTTLSFSTAPNPFNPSTTIRFSLLEDTPLEVCVYNLRGQRVTTLAKGDYTRGDYSLVWNGNDADGRPVSSGVYFCRMQAGGRTATGKLLLLK